MTQLTVMMRDWTGNVSQLSLSPSLPLCLSGGWSAIKTYTNTWFVDLSLITNMPVYYEIFGDIPQIITGFSSLDEQITLQLSGWTWQKQFNWSLFATGNKLLIGSGVVVLDTFSPELHITSHTSGYETTNSSVMLQGLIKDDFPLNFLKINGIILIPQGTGWSKNIVLNLGRNTILVEAMDLAGNLVDTGITIVRNVIQQGGGWGGGGWGGWENKVNTDFSTGYYVPYQSWESALTSDKNLAISIQYHAQKGNLSVKVLEQKVLHLQPIVHLIFSLPKYSNMMAKTLVKNIFTEAQSSSKNPLIRAASTVLLENWSW